MDCIDIIEIEISLDYVLANMYDLVTKLKKYNFNNNENMISHLQYVFMIRQCIHDNQKMINVLKWNNG